jgi:hypothetical protein
MHYVGRYKISFQNARSLQYKILMVISKQPLLHSYVASIIYASPILLFCVA